MYKICKIKNSAIWLVIQPDGVTFMTDSWQEAMNFVNLLIKHLWSEALEYTRKRITDE